MRGEKEDLDYDKTDNYDHKGGSKCSLSIKYEIHSQFLPSQRVFKKVSALSESFQKKVSSQKGFCLFRRPHSETVTSNKNKNVCVRKVLNYKRMINSRKP